MIDIPGLSSQTETYGNIKNNTYINIFYYFYTALGSICTKLSRSFCFDNKLSLKIALNALSFLQELKGIHNPVQNIIQINA